MGKLERNLSRRERQIMDIVYAKGEATAAEVHEAIPDPPSKTSVRTLLRILETKGHLSHFEDGPRYVYRAVRSRERAWKIFAAARARYIFRGFARTRGRRASHRLRGRSLARRAQAAFATHQPGPKKRTLG